MSKATLDGFGRTTIGLEPFKPSPDVTEQINQAVSYLCVWDYTNEIWRPVASDVDGRLVVSMAGISINTAINAAITCGVAATLLLPNKPSRRKFALYNNSATVVYIGFSATVSAVNGFPLASGAAFVEEAYSGEIWGISGGGAANMRYMEF
jgi:hypothetical protein